MKKETFIGESITPEDASFSTAAMARGEPGFPGAFRWRGRSYTALAILEQWKQSGPCRHGSGERYVRQHWFRVKTVDDIEMTIYFERQRRSSGGSRWRLHTMRDTEPHQAPGLKKE